ncbi:MAG TPA: hypothetical protein VIH90_08220 [Candidatus Saccharimonadales bacterium]
MATTREKAPKGETEKTLSAEQRLRITKLAGLSREEDKPDFSKSGIIPAGFNGTVHPSKLAVEFFYRTGVITRDEEPSVREALLATEAVFAKLEPEERATYGHALTGTEFDEKFFVVEDLVRDFHGNTFDGNLEHVKGFIGFIILSSMSEPTP